MEKINGLFDVANRFFQGFAVYIFFFFGFKINQIFSIKDFFKLYNAFFYKNIESLC